MFENIFLLIAIFILGGSIGGFIVLKYLEKSMDELIECCDNLVKSQRRVIELDNSIIKQFKEFADRKEKLVIAYEGVIEKAYLTLVDLRDSGTENLDETIGFIGEALSDYKGDSECNSNQ